MIQFGGEQLSDVCKQAFSNADYSYNRWQDADFVYTIIEQCCEILPSFV